MNKSSILRRIRLNVCYSAWVNYLWSIEIIQLHFQQFHCLNDRSFDKPYSMCFLNRIDNPFNRLQADNPIHSEDMNLPLLAHHHFHLTFNEIYQLLSSVHLRWIGRDEESSKLYLSKKLSDQICPMEHSVVCNYRDFWQIQFFIQLQIWNEFIKKVFVLQLIERWLCSHDAFNSHLTVSNNEAHFEVWNPDQHSPGLTLLRPTISSLGLSVHSKIVYEDEIVLLIK